MYILSLLKSICKKINRVLDIFYDMYWKYLFHWINFRWGLKSIKLVVQHMLQIFYKI